MGKIGDLWIRLGLKKDGFDSGMDSAKGKVNDMGGTFNKLKGVALGVWAAIGVAAMKLAKDVINSNQVIGDSWNREMAGLKASWDTFVSSLANADFSNFISRMREASKAAKELADALDAEYEVMNSIKIERAQQSEQLEQLRIDMNNANKSYDERAAAAKKYLSIVEPLYQREIQLRKDIMDAQVKQFTTAAKVDFEGNSQKVIEFLKVMGQLTAEETKALNLSISGKAIDQRYKEMPNYGEVIQQVGEKANMASSEFRNFYNTYQKWIKEEKVTDITTSIEAYYNSLSKMSSENRRVFTAMNTATAAADKESASFARAQEERVTGLINLRQKELEQLIKNRDAATDISEISMLNQKIAALERILSLTKSINTEAIVKVETGIEGKATTNSPFANMDKQIGAYYDNVIQKNREAIDKIKKQQEELENISYAFAASLTDGLGSGLDYIADALAGVVEFDSASLIKAILTPLADMAVKAGLMIMLTGEAVEAARTALTSFFGVGAIAAGAILVAAGTALKVGLAAIPSGGGGSSHSAPQTSYSGGVIPQQKMQIEVTGTLKGQDISLSLDQYNKNKGR